MTNSELWSLIHSFHYFFANTQRCFDVAVAESVRRYTVVCLLSSVLALFRLFHSFLSGLPLSGLDTLFNKASQAIQIPSHKTIPRYGQTPNWEIL